MIDFECIQQTLGKILFTLSYANQCLLKKKKRNYFHGEELGISTRGRNVHGVLTTLNIFLSLCGYDFMTLVLRQGRGEWVGKAEGEEKEEMDIKDVYIL